MTPAPDTHADTLLVEIRCEELPPAQVAALAERFPQQLLGALRQAGFGDDASAIKTGADKQSLLLATPRRFAALLTNIRAASAAAAVRRRGPALAACYDKQGNASKALAGFIRAVGAGSAEALITISEKGRDYVAFDETRGGGALADSLAAIVQQVLLAFNAPRLMRWGGNDFKFIRPLRGALLMHGKQTLAGDIMGIAAAAATLGHPVLAPQPLSIASADDYVETLAEQGKALCDFVARRDEIAKKIGGLSDKLEALLHEVTAMCEQPGVYQGKIDDAFLAMPSFYIEECMVKHQRAFPIYSGDQLSARYHFIADNHPADPEKMISGFNTVLRARLRDVEFYRSEDSKLTHEAAREKMRHITYHRLLGSQAQRVERLEKIAASIADLLKLTDTERELLLQAAAVCKSDLPTLMIGEYPSLEGRVAADYFCRDNPALAALVRCQAARDWEQEFEDIKRLHIEARQAAGILLLTIKLEQLVALFAAGETPSGSKDPHGLRAAAACCADLLADADYEEKLQVLTGKTLMQAVTAAFSDVDGIDAPAAADKVWTFIAERRRQRLLEQGASAEVLNALLARPPDRMAELHYKASALESFIRTPAAEALIAAHKRISNILRKSDSTPAAAAVDESLLQENAEKNLCQQLRAAEAKANKAPADYRALLENTAALRPAVDQFFDEVLVNCEDEALRRNRLALLAALKSALNAVGDLSMLHGG